jgi:hypothetical protein
MTAESIKPIPITKRKQVNRVNKTEAVRLKIDHNLTYKEIGTLQGVTPTAIHNAIKDLLPTEHTEVFKTNRADIFSEMQRKLLNGVDAERIKKAPAGSLILAACQLYDKERLERGQSTGNLLTIHADIAALRAVDNSKTNNT